MSGVLYGKWRLKNKITGEVHPLPKLGETFLGEWIIEPCDPDESKDVCLSKREAAALLRSGIAPESVRVSFSGDDFTKGINKLREAAQ